MTRTVGIYLFDDVEVLDFAGPFEVFSTASRVKRRVQPEAGVPFEVLTIADARRPIRARGGLRVEPHVDIALHPHLDVLVIPGGVVAAELQREEVIAWIARVAAGTSVTASVCTGAFLLGRAGLLDGRRATTHWEDAAEMRKMFPTVDVRAGPRWVDAGPVVTSAGISAGIDMSLHLVARLEGEDLAVRTARQMEFDWQRPCGA
jgi:transcriptional regulator GlxA family with amidase domain